MLPLDAVVLLCTTNKSMNNLIVPEDITLISHLATRNCLLHIMPMLPGRPRRWRARSQFNRLGSSE
jgi:hypothetical protein